MHSLRAFAATTTLLVNASLQSAQNVRPFHGQAFSYDTDSIVVEVASLDWDGDGNLDLIAAHDAPNALEVHLGAGDGTVADAFEIGLPSPPRALHDADVDLDGEDDALLVLANGEVLLVERGSSGNALVRTLTLPSLVTALAPGDLDSDGDADLVTLTVSGDAIVLLNQAGVFVSSGGFAAAADIAARIALEQVADGSALDVVMWSPDRADLRVFKGNGSGGFAPGILTSLAALPRRCVFADLNMDGLHDVAVLNATGDRVDTLSATGAGSFTLAHSAPLADATNGDLALADWNADGRPDLTTLDAKPSVSVRLASPAGTWTSPSTRPAAERAGRLLALDLDRDHHLELIQFGCGMIVAPRQGLDPRGVRRIASAQAPGWFEIADIDQDGDFDVVTTPPSRLHLNDGAGGFTSAASFNSQGRPFAADFDSDGHTDVAIGTKLFRGLGGAQFAAATSPFSGGTLRSYGDVDHDGDLDVVLRSIPFARMELRLNDGAGSFGLPLTTSSYWDLDINTSRDAVLADVGGSSALDLVMRFDGQMVESVYVHYGNGDGTFGQSCHLYSGPYPLGDLGQLTVGDIERDGDQDVVVGTTWVIYDLPAAPFVVLRNDGFANFQPSFHPTATGLLEGEVVLSDLDGDGDLDIHAPQLNRVHAHTSAGVFAPSVSWPHGALRASAGGRDLDGDGDADLLASVAGYSGFLLVAGRTSEEPRVYCDPSPNSAGCVADVSWIGHASSTSGLPFQLSATGVFNQRMGLLVYGALPNDTPFRGEVLCVRPPLQRTSIGSSGGAATGNDCSGALTFDFNARIAAGADPSLVMGAEVCVQFVARDGALSGWVHLTQAVRFLIGP